MEGNRTAIAMLRSFADVGFLQMISDDMWEKPPSDYCMILTGLVATSEKCPIRISIDLVTYDKKIKWLK